jgi:hypothetical protein
MAIKYSNQTGLSITKLLEAPFAGKHPNLIKKGTKAAAAEAAVAAAEANAVANLEETKRLAAEFVAKPGDPFRECWLAHERLRVSEARSINRAEILTARTDASAEVAEVAAAEAAAAEAAAAAGAAAKVAAYALGARTALAPEPPKESVDPPADLISALKLRVLGDLYFSRRRISYCLQMF